MNWKTKLIAATGAFVSMPAATIAEVNSICGARRARRVRRVSVSSAPVFVGPGTGHQQLKVGGQFFKIRDLTSDGESTGAVPACDHIKIDLSLIDTETGNVLDNKTLYKQAGTGFVAAFDIEEMPDVNAVSVEAVVAPIDQEDKLLVSPDNSSVACHVAPVEMSFMLQDLEGRKTYVPSVSNAWPAKWVGPYLKW